MKKDYQFPRVKVVEMEPEAAVLQVTGSIEDTHEG